MIGNTHSLHEHAFHVGTAAAISNHFRDSKERGTHSWAGCCHLLRESGGGRLLMLRIMLFESAARGGVSIWPNALEKLCDVPES
ncbi:hypothetical protein A0H81_09497 [Grifola frondosa]|uniref:Uncharacterized protein n=1 Tax=Grifola frondosa TaxID=5627 RepID=A0A1C7M275_GRIFR|nr:hypothetical protein A0H81_09497 [Grifola frondosa]